MAWDSSPVIAGLWIAVMGFAAILPLAIAYVGKAIVDAVVERAPGPALTWVAVELLLMMLVGAAGRGSGVLRGLLGVRLGLHVNLKILRKALTLELLQFQDPEFYDRLTRARREASSRPLALAGELLGVGGSLVTLLGFVALLLSFSPLAVLVLIAAGFPATLAELRFSREAFDLRHRRTTEARRLGYLEYVLASDEHAKEVMMLGLGPALLARYEAVGERLWREERGLSVRRTLWVTLLAQLGSLAFYGCYALIVWRTAKGELGLGDMTLYVLAFRQGQQLFQAILLGVGSLYEHELYMANLLEFLHREGKPVRPALPMIVTNGVRGIRFEDVGFRYPGQEGFALRHVDLEMAAGTSIALVGHNGAGKSTFIKLLTGLYEPTEGRVLLDGVDLRQIDRADLRRRLSVVFQDYNQYQFTAGENVGYGRPEAVADAAAIARAVEDGGARAVIEGLPMGLETQLGRWFPGGVELSGGQWQRVALARAFMRSEADVVVLDEPTAALDVDAEAELFERVRASTAGRTLLLISHRLANVRLADWIVVLGPRGVIESGTHAALMAEGGHYAAMFRKQAQGYA
ncbi:ABC transporter ATP-binding protein [Nannocystis punicea]|uniref:ABC transporter ATP-binding protein n=1 Tax=Nannocystis punicea TaxID=2995304 RepID=A0ABY7H524_9BACT|nr:ABC transporter ATP-binding protein [Nannocystis poenicansa]WAS94190.1 ABC transporter ATP-binding protein [Nannocystis poenicansa]